VKQFIIKQQMLVENKKNDFDDIEQFIFSHEDNAASDENNFFIGEILVNSVADDHSPDPSKIENESPPPRDPLLDVKTATTTSIGIDYLAVWNLLMSPICRDDTTPALEELQLYNAEMLEHVDDFDEYETVFRLMKPVQRRSFSLFMRLELHAAEWAATLADSPDYAGAWQLLEDSGKDTLTRIESQFGVEKVQDLCYLTSAELQACLPEVVSFLVKRKFLIAICIVRPHSGNGQQPNFEKVWDTVSRFPVLRSYLLEQYSIESWEDLNCLLTQELVELFEVVGKDALKLATKKYAKEILKLP